ncbi:hypothetical protein SPAR80_1689 [Streptococcus pneumoniae GA44194]|nr:hypothetical protein SPAR80_1689 [Streptococcus pneumoniae GA44194]EHZ57837.1 hypothetical protein SPAR88_1654 [Streptococcus pneumoniae GA47179]EHZ70230.1 hypothetical protein SPAR107_1643 [Streptococcus pneumoniae GA47794]EJG84528.1 hypothetical protein SPAR117_1480 [Streptococcus pneumoniae GA52612]
MNVPINSATNFSFSFSFFQKLDTSLSKVGKGFKKIDWKFFENHRTIS